MTIIELATFLKIPPRTMFHWAKKASAKVSDKMAHAKSHNKAADLTLAECVEVVKAGGNHVLAEFLEASANVQGQPRTNERVPESQPSQRVTSVTRPKLPNGIQLRALVDAAKAKLMTPVQFQEAIGVTIPGRGPIEGVRLIEAPASPETIERELRSLMPVQATIAANKVDAAASGARNGALARQVSRLTQDRMNYHLPLDRNPA